MAFRTPRFDLPIDVEEDILHLPPGATIKGYCIQSALDWAKQVGGDAADIISKAGVAQSRFMAFLDYPYEDFMRVAVAAARLGKPDQPVGKSLYEIGVFLYRSIQDLQFGKIYFAIVGDDLHRIAKSAVKAYGVTVNFGTVTVEDTGTNSFVFQFRDLPAFLETYQFGIITGGVTSTDKTPKIEIDVIDRANADIAVTWSE